MANRLKNMLAIMALALVMGTVAVTEIGAAPAKKPVVLKLGDTEVTVNLYEKEGRAITFIAPHFTEQTGARMAKETIEREGGRLIEIESRDAASGRPIRNLLFTIAGKNYQIDPNRMFTENGRTCAGLPPVAAQAAAAFAEAILKLALADDGRSLRQGERFLVALHNNADIDGRAQEARAGDLTAVGFIRAHAADSTFHGAFEAQADGVFLSNTETDADNFVYLSTPVLISHFAERGFNVVVQKPVSKLNSKACSVDDGSLSILAARLNIPYINLEADMANGAFRQRQMIAAVYELIPAIKPDAIAVTK